MPKRALWFGLAALMLVPPIAATFSGCQTTCTTTADCGDGDFCSLAPGICATPRSIGFCKPIPASCPAAVQLVCGCDSKQYVNQCTASLAGQSVVSNGACVVGCGGPGNLACPDGQFCQFKDGDCSGAVTPGTCVARQASCVTAPPLPVCGCDGKTYASRCDAALTGKAGVNVALTGACPCGGPGNNHCESGKFCNYLLGTCTGPSPTGTCTVPPQSCPAFVSPVCGCDGKGYDNACLAAQAQVPLVSITPCAVACGGATNTACPASQFCDFGMPGNCLKPDAVGVCGAKPTTCSVVSSKVCGCDGAQYLNACEAAKQGASVASSGVCNFADAGADASDSGIADAADGG